MDAWVIWLVAAVVLAVAEVVNTSFFLFPFSIGAGGAALVALAGAGPPLAVVVFPVLPALSFGIVRPIARRHLSQPAALRTGTAALVGKREIGPGRSGNRPGAG